MPKVGQGASDAGKPNILFIMVDEMRWDAMGCAGSLFAKTPNLDLLAKEGTRFSATYTCAPVCVPSRYCFFTARYPHSIGAKANSTPTHPGELFLPAILRNDGYQTAISGKLHFLPSGREFGFDYFWSFASEGPGKQESWPIFLDKKYGKDARKLLDQPYPDDPLGQDIGRPTYAKEDQQSFWITDRAIDFLNLRDKAKPFFLFVSYLDPHSPSHLTEPYWSMYDYKKMPRPKIPEEVKQARAKALQAGLSGPGPTRSYLDNEEMAQKLMATYFAKIAMVDDNIGRLLAEMKKQGLMENTLVVFTSDHGNMLGDRGRWFKGIMYDGSSRIPLLMKAPPESKYAATFNQGKTINEVVKNIDVMPTLLEMSGHSVEGRPGIQGKSLAKLVAGNYPQWDNTAYASLGTQMVRTAQYKLIASDKSCELYDMIKDPKEELDLAKDPAFAKVLTELQAKLEAWFKDSPPPPVIQGVEASTSPKPEELKKGGKRKQSEE